MIHIDDLERRLAEAHVVVGEQKVELVKQSWELAALRSKLAEAEKKWCSWGIVEIAVRNPSVADYCKHWEERTEKAEAELAALRAERDEAIEARDYTIDALLKDRDRLKKALEDSELLCEAKAMTAEDRRKQLHIVNGEMRKLREVMVAAAEEIHQHWDAHCDKDGYGPANLQRRLEEALAVSYPGYSIGEFATLRAELRVAKAQVAALEEQVIPLQAERDRLREALSKAAAALYNGFEPDNQSRAWKAAYAALAKEDKP